MTARHRPQHIPEQARAFDLVAALAAWMPDAVILPGWNKDQPAERLLLEVHDEH